jgi:hypothetical protein
VHDRVKRAQSHSQARAPQSFNMYSYRARKPHNAQGPQYSFKDDIIHTPSPPYDFYVLKGGAKEKLARKKQLGGNGTTSRFLGVFPRWFLPFDAADLPYVRDLLLDTFFLCPSLWLKYLCAEPIPSPYHTFRCDLLQFNYHLHLPTASLLVVLLRSNFHHCESKPHDVSSICDELNGVCIHKVQAAVDKREVDRSLMMHAFAGTAICNLLLRLKTWFNYEDEIDLRIDTYFSARIIRGESVDRSVLFLSCHDVLMRDFQTQQRLRWICQLARMLRHWQN